MKKITTAFASLLLLVGCATNSVTNTEKAEKPDSQAACDSRTENCDSTERGSVKEEIPSYVQQITLNESLEYLNETAVLFFSFDDCPWCYDAWPVINDVWKNYNVPLYYVSVERDERDDTNEDYQKLVEFVKDELTEEQKIYMPFALFIKDGKIVGSNTGTVEGQQMIDDELPLITDEQKTELTEIYTKLFDKLIN